MRAPSAAPVRALSLFAFACYAGGVAGVACSPAGSGGGSAGQTGSAGRGGSSGPAGSAGSGTAGMSGTSGGGAGGASSGGATAGRGGSGGAVNSTVSEGIAYGMLLSVFANDQPTFDKLWQYSQHWPDANGLMNWYISSDGTQVLGTGAASDADEDMAYALIAADARWGGKGSLSTNYIDLAKTLIGKIWQYEIDHG